MNEHNHNMFNIPSKCRELAFIKRTQETPINVDMYAGGINNVEIKRYNMTNIFEENSYLLQIKRRLELQNDHLSVLHCTNIIDKLPILCNFELYRLHIRWFFDDFIVYATNHPCDITIEHSEHLQHQICEQLHQHQIHVVGLIESPLQFISATLE